MIPANATGRWITTDRPSRAHGIDQSIAAWDQLGTRGLVLIAEAHDFIVDLMWQRDELERLFPKARGFVRAAFDEPDEVAKLLAAEKNGP